MRSTQIIQILNNFPVDSQLTKLQRRGTNEYASRDQKELATEVTSKKLCRCVGLVTSVDWKMLGKIISPEQSKTKVNDFATGVPNKRQCLRSSQQLPWSSRMGWQAVSTTIFKCLLNLWLKMWTNYCIVAADNLLEGRTSRVSKRLASLALGS